MNQTLGTRIASLRKEHRMTQEDLAEHLSVSPQAVSKWENDSACPDISLLPKLAQKLGVSVDWLLSGESSPEIQLLPAEHRKSLDQLLLRISVLSAEGDKVRVNLPMELVRIALETGLQLPQLSGRPFLQNIDFQQIFALAEKGVLGRLVEVESAEGDLVEIVVEELD